VKLLSYALLLMKILLFFVLKKMTQMIQINKMAHRKISYKSTYSNRIIYSGEIKT